MSVTNDYLQDKVNMPFKVDMDDENITLINMHGIHHSYIFLRPNLVRMKSPPHFFFATMRELEL
jgi:hypothetical protein